MEGEKSLAGELKNHIRKKIARFYKKRMIAPAILIVFLIVMFIALPVRSLFDPVPYSDMDSAKAKRSDGATYVNADLSKLYFTGYRKMIFGQTYGYYYYSVTGEECTLILLSGRTCEQGIPVIENLRFSARITEKTPSEDRLISLLARDLSWNEAGLAKNISSFVLNEPKATGPVSVILKVAIFFSLFFAIFSLALNFLYAYFPVTSPPVRRLSLYGNAMRLLNKAERELSTLPQLATEDMYITQNFFIETAQSGIAIVPIKEIIWIYKYSTLHKLLWHVFTISYTLYITTTHRQVIKCPKNQKSDIDGIMDYLAEANHSILTGFSEKNREETSARQGEGVFLTKLKKLLNKSPKAAPKEEDS